MIYVQGLLIKHFYFASVLFTEIMMSWFENCHRIQSDLSN